jgi:hypothetical protein
LELQVDSNKLLYKDFDQEVRRILGEEEPQQDIGDKPSPEDWVAFATRWSEARRLAPRGHVTPKLHEE